MNLTILLLTLALISAVVYSAAGTKGVVVVVVTMLVVAVVSFVSSPSAAMVVGYGFAFGWPVLAGSIAAGCMAGALFQKRKYVWALLPFLPFAYVFWNSEVAKENQSTEKQLVYDFVFKHKDLARLTGGPVRASLVTSTTYSDAGRAKYEFCLEAKEPLYAIIEVDRSAGQPVVKLACVTSLYFGQRDTSNSGCEKDVVSLDETKWAIASSVTAPVEEIPEVPPIPSNAQVSMIGVYEGKPKSNNTPRPVNEEPVAVRVVITASNVPLVLALNSYRPVNWTIENQGRPISAVLLSGILQSTVTGTTARVVPIGKRFAYDDRQDDFIKLKQQVSLIAHTPVKDFQGTYYGTEFYVRATK
jgi:hypothetical protein